LGAFKDNGYQLGNDRTRRSGQATVLAIDAHDAQLRVENTTTSNRAAGGKTLTQAGLISPA